MKLQCTLTYSQKTDTRKSDNNKMEAADHATKCAKKRRPDERPDEKPAETPTKKAKEAEHREITWMENYASERDKSILKKLAKSGGMIGLS